MGNFPIERETGSYTLEELGITKSTDVYGDERLTISLPPNSLFGIGQGQAVFNPQTRRWEISVTGNTRFSQKIDLSLKRRDSEPNHIDLAARPVKWTEALPRTEHVDRFLSDIDWRATSLGPLETWPSSLQAYLNIVFADSQAAVIYWGDDLVALYNSEFLKLVTGRLTKPHELLGLPFTRIWPELWADFEPMLKMIAAQGTGLDAHEVTLFPLRNGVPEETIWQGSFLPIRDDSGSVKGFYNRAREITGPLVAERRARVLNAVSAEAQLAGTGVFQHLINALAISERDFPMTFVYSAHEDLLTGKCPLHLECSEGLPEQGHPLVPAELQLYEGQTGFTPHLRRAKSYDKVLVLHVEDDTLPAELVRGFRWRGFGEPARSLAILPLSTNDRLMGFIVLGLNPRRPYDKEHEGFLNTLLRSMSAIVSNAIDREEARDRADRLAKQLAHSERSIREIAEYGPVGIAQFSPGGKLMWGNDQYYEITGHGREFEDHYEKSFYDIVIEGDRETCKKAFEKLYQGHKAISATLRVKKTWHPPRSPDSNEDEHEQNVYVLVAGYPMMEGHELKACALSVVDVSRFKWAEQVQSKVAASAKEAKRLQENFIDIVSHEMRNPLSAITQLSDAISGSVDDFESSSKTVEDAVRILESNVENATTILLCAAHQKRIIDDVLTLSKLDSMLLSITPVVVQPCTIIEGVLRMFEAEFVASDIQVHHERTQAYIDSKVDWVSLDPSRLTQIFINLITNAVKFTKFERERRITIRISASRTRPPSLAGVQWFPTNKRYKDLTRNIEWGEGEDIYICFEVQDTGRGLEQEEMTKLFGRFQQATEKTHLKYGGSGLGLFISRELTETQGGEIGVISQPGKGTTFAFYVKGRRAEPPDDPSPSMPQPRKTRSPRGQTREAEQQEDAQSDDSNRAKDRFTILLCEDNVVNSKVMQQQLQKQGCEVHLANHGMEALDLLGRSSAWNGMDNEPQAMNFDVILMDVEMPIMDGITCTRRIRQLENEKKLTHRTHIIAITANARKEQIDSLIQAGCDDVLPKPFRVKDCLQKIRVNFEQERTRKARDKLHTESVALRAKDSEFASL